MQTYHNRRAEEGGLTNMCRNGYEELSQSMRDFITEKTGKHREEFFDKDAIGKLVMLGRTYAHQVPRPIKGRCIYVSL